MKLEVDRGFHSQNAAAEELEEVVIEAGEQWKRAEERDGGEEVRLQEQGSHNLSVACLQRFKVSMDNMNLSVVEGNLYVMKRSKKRRDICYLRLGWVNANRESGQKESLADLDQ